MKDVNPPAIVAQADADLKQLAAAINSREQRSDEAAVKHARAQGDDLLRAKAACGHGHWQTWARENLSLSLPQIRRYMQFAKTLVTSVLAEEVEAWRRISGNADDQAVEPQPDAALLLARLRAAEAEVRRLQARLEASGWTEDDDDEDDDDWPASLIDVPVPALRPGCSYSAWTDDGEAVNYVELIPVPGRAGAYRVAVALADGESAEWRYVSRGVYLARPGVWDRWATGRFAGVTDWQEHEPPHEPLCEGIGDAEARRDLIGRMTAGSIN